MKYLFAITKGLRGGYARGSLLANTGGLNYARYYRNDYSDGRTPKYDMRTRTWRALKAADRIGARVRIKITCARVNWGLALTTCNNYTLKGTFKLAIKKLVCKATGREFQMEFNI